MMKEKKYPVVSQRFKDILYKKRMTAQDLSNLSGVSKNSISQYVNGSHCPSNYTATKLAEVLNVPAPWLMGFDTKQNYSFDSLYVEMPVPLSIDRSDPQIPQMPALEIEIIKSEMEKLKPQQLRVLKAYAEYLILNYESLKEDE